MPEERDLENKGEATKPAPVQTERCEFLRTMGTEFEGWLEYPAKMFGPAERPRPPRLTVEPVWNEYVPREHHPWYPVFAQLHRRVRHLLCRFRMDTGARGAFSVDVVGFANWAVALRFDRCRRSWPSYRSWARAAIEALPATAADRARSLRILGEEDGAASSDEIAARTGFARSRRKIARARKRSARKRASAAKKREQQTS